MNENWNRLAAVIKWAGMSTNSFALHVGLKRSENLYQIKKGNHGISKTLAYTIKEKFPEISTAWLLTGEGTMLSDEEPEKVIPPDLKSRILMAIADMVENEPRKEIPISEVYVFAGKAVNIVLDELQTAVL